MPGVIDSLTIKLCKLRNKSRPSNTVFTLLVFEVPVAAP